MLKKIPVEALRTGMHLHELCGSWLNHPFWKTNFLLRDPADVRKVQVSGVTECWIDVSRGLDVEEQPAEPAVAPAPPPVAPLASAPPATPVARAEAPPPASRVEMAAELQRAAELCNKSRQAVTSLFAEARLGRALDAEQCVELVEEVTNSVYRNPGALVSLARLKTHDDYTYMHSVAVCALMVALARQLKLPEPEVRDAGMAGLLHDIGKSAMPIEVLNKPGKLTDAEFDIMRSHPVRGHEILTGGRGVSAMTLDVCLHHHEKIDGTGYPKKLTAEQITLHAKMGAVCDVYDAITSNRPYKAGWDPAQSIQRMAGWTQGHLDPVVFKAFVTSLGIYPTGSLVRLQSGLLAVVTEQNEAALVAPKVRVFFSTKSNLPVTTRIVDLAAADCNDRIIGRESNDTWKFKHLEELWADPAVLKATGRKGA